MTRFQGKYPARFVEVLWFLYQERGLSSQRLADALGVSERGMRSMLAKSGHRPGVWAEHELRSLMAEHIGGIHISALAKRRRRYSAELIAAWARFDLVPPVRKKGGGREKRIPTDQVAKMYAFYQTGKSFAETERHFGAGKNNVRNIFISRGLDLRESLKNSWRQRRPDGSWLQMPPKTEEEIEALIQAATVLAIPEDLRVEWRKWDLARRVDFIRRVRARLKRSIDRPELPFSDNVMPFDYGTPEAWEIVNHTKNAGAKLKIQSQGVIYQGQLWFWSGSACCYLLAVKWTPEKPRPSLHRSIWESIHGPITPDLAVTYKDGNPNNLDPGNLELRSKNEICRENQASAITRKSREKMEILLARTERKNQDHDLLANLTH